MAKHEDMRPEISLFSIKVQRLKEEAERIKGKLQGEAAQNWDSIAGELDWIQGRLGDPDVEIGGEV